MGRRQRGGGQGRGCLERMAIERAGALGAGSQKGWWSERGTGRARMESEGKKEGPAGRGRGGGARGGGGSGGRCGRCRGRQGSSGAGSILRGRGAGRSVQAGGEKERRQGAWRWLREVRGRSARQGYGWRGRGSRETGEGSNLGTRKERVWGEVATGMGRCESDKFAEGGLGGWAEGRGV